MDVLRYRFTARRSEWVMSPDERIQPERSSYSTPEETAVKQSRLDHYQRLAEQGLPLEGMADEA